MLAASLVAAPLAAPAHARFAPERTAAAVAMALELVGDQRECRPGNGRRIGNVIGAIGGALIGRAIDGGRNRGTGTIVGGVVGTLIGGELGAALDRCEQQKLRAAELEAANSLGNGDRGSTEWRSDSRPNTWGTVTPGARSTRGDGRECRPVTYVSYIEGQERHDQRQLCRRPPSTEWA